MSLYTVAAFYKFVALTELVSLQTELKHFCKDHTIFGTIILATEGINGTLVGEDKDIKAIIKLLREKPSFSDLECKFSISDFRPFHKSWVHIKKEIVTFGVEGLKPEQKTGIHVNHLEWNQLISEPDVLVIDTRNTYETELGSFKGAIDPETKKFTDFPIYVKEKLDPNKHKKIAMYCTGGIRCEKASAYLLAQGFEKVYQLQGGILKYLEKVSPENSLWEGKCFIFDDRIVLEKDAIQTEDGPFSDNT